MTKLEDLTFDDRMTPRLHCDLVNHLQFKIFSPKDCTGNQHTVAFLRARHVDIAEALAWLKEHGASCDCEVLLNTAPWASLPPKRRNDEPLTERERAGFGALLQRHRDRLPEVAAAIEKFLVDCGTSPTALSERRLARLVTERLLALEMTGTLQ